MIDINNFVSYQCEASFSIDDEKKNIILINMDISEDICNDFCLKLAGIKKANNFYYNNQIMYDNNHYFDSRIYLDSNIKYFKTLNENIIAETLLEKYQKIIDKELFKKLVHDLGIRKNYSYHKLISKGNDLFCIALALSCFNNSIIKLSDNSINNYFNDLKLIEELIKKSVFGFTIITKYDKEILKDNAIKYFDYIYLVKKESVKKINTKDVVEE